MYRVVTKSMQARGKQRSRCIHNGPWHPDESKAMQWAQYLKSTGFYDHVEVESNLSSQSGKRYEQD
jgi:hypothetical protein